MAEPARPHFHTPVECTIDGKPRLFMLGPDAYRRAQRALGGTDPREALTRGGLDPVCIVGACARHFEEKRTSDKTIEEWVTRDPKKTPELIEAVSECVRRHLVQTGVIEEAGTGEG